MAAVQPRERDLRQAVSWSLTVPRQHGAWSVLLLGFALGAGIAGSLGLPSLLLLISLTSAMPLRHVAALWLRLAPTDGRRRSVQAWAVMYALVAALPLLPLLLIYHRWLLVPMGAIAVVAGLAMTLLERARLDRTLWGEMAGMLGLSVTVPAAAYVPAGVLDPQVMAVWLLAALVFCGGVLHVRHVVREGRGTGEGTPRGRAGLVSVAFHVFGLVVAAGLGWLGVIPRLAFFALAPAMLRSVWPLLQPAGRKIPVRRLGFEELAYGALFVVLAVLLLHS